jgi:hypothetical protein
MKDLMKLKNATRLAVALTVLLVAACAEPMDGASITTVSKNCLDAGGVPDYFHNGMKTQFQCSGLSN